MVAPAAATTNVYTQEINGSTSKLSFGLAIPAQLCAPLDSFSLGPDVVGCSAVLTVACGSGADHHTSIWEIWKAAEKAGQEDELVFGFIQADVSFSKTMCTGAVEYTKSLGLKIANVNGEHLVHAGPGHTSGRPSRAVSVRVSLCPCQCRQRAGNGPLSPPCYRGAQGRHTVRCLSTAPPAQPR